MSRLYPVSQGCREAVSAAHLGQQNKRVSPTFVLSRPKTAAKSNLSRLKLTHTHRCSQMPMSRAHLLYEAFSSAVEPAQDTMRPTYRGGTCSSIKGLSQERRQHRCRCVRGIGRITVPSPSEPLSHRGPQEHADAEYLGGRKSEFTFEGRARLGTTPNVRVYGEIEIPIDSEPMDISLTVGRTFQNTWRVMPAYCLRSKKRQRCLSICIAQMKQWSGYLGHSMHDSAFAVP